MAGNFIKVNRKVLDNWVGSNVHYLGAWVYILMRANWKDTKVLVGNNFIICKRGQFITSISEFAKSTGLTYKQVRHFWELLKKDKMIGTQKGRHWTVLTVYNYERYQGQGQTEGSLRAVLGQQSKNSKEEEKKYISKDIYKEKKMEAGVSDEYKSFVNFLFTGGPDGGEFKKCLSLPTGQISPKNFEMLSSKYSKFLIAEKINEMEATKDLLKKYENFYLTLSNWCNMAMKRGWQRTK